MKLFDLFHLAEAWAASSGAEGHAAPISQLFFPLLNFLIFAYLIKRFVLPVIQDYLRSRREAILSSVKEADQAKKRAEETVQEYRSRLARLEEEMKAIQEDLRKEGEREKMKLVQEATNLATRIQEDARFLSEQEFKLARQAVRQEMALKAQLAATEMIQGQLTAADQNRLVEEFLRGVGQSR
jgi:F-type H+-transporting ATPase subunit b